MQPETSEDPVLSVGDVAEALERLQLSEELREDGLPEHSYPRRDEDLEMVYAFAEAVGELPPTGFFRRLVWYVRLRWWGG